MTEEQLKELCDALVIMSSKSSVLKERDELRSLMEENLQAEEVLPSTSPPHLLSSNPLSRIPSPPQAL
jgi:LETM1 and EF-hand domain-containing protein 1